MTVKEICEKILKGLLEEVFRKTRLLDNNTIYRINTNVEKYELAKLLRITVVNHMKKLTEEVDKLQKII